MAAGRRVPGRLPARDRPCLPGRPAGLDRLVHRRRSAPVHRAAAPRRPLGPAPGNTPAAGDRAAGRGRHHRPPAVLPVRVLRLRPPGGRIAGVLPGRQRPPPDGERGLPHRRAVRRRAGPAAHRRRTPLPAVRGARDDTARLAYTTSYALIRRLARRAGCRTSRTPSATPTPAPPAATTAPGTTSTGTPPTRWPPNCTARPVRHRSSPARSPAKTAHARHRAIGFRRWGGGMVAGQGGPLDGGCGPHRV